MNKQKLIVILGPTATGKSDLAVRLAKKFGGEVVSADSRQVYKGLDIGTGKITRREMRGIPHHLLDVASPRNLFSVAEYKKQAEKAISTIYRRGKVPIIAGGTGFYIDALVQDASLPLVPPNKNLRKKLSKYSTEKLFSLLKKKDPRRAKDIDPKNPHRLIRALEIVETLGKVPPKKKTRSDYEPLFIGLTLSPDELKKKIRVRALSRMKQGMLAEARRLHKEGVSYKRMRSLGLEYRLLAGLLEKKIIKDVFVDELSDSTVKYVKRQMTWFKRNKEIVWFKPTDMRRIEKKVKAFLS